MFGTRRTGSSWRNPTLAHMPGNRSYVTHEGVTPRAPDQRRVTASSNVSRGPRGCRPADSP